MHTNDGVNCFSPELRDTVKTCQSIYFVGSEDIQFIHSCSNVPCMFTYSINTQYSMPPAVLSLSIYIYVELCYVTLSLASPMHQQTAPLKPTAVKQLTFTNYLKSYLKHRKHSSQMNSFSSDLLENHINTGLKMAYQII